MLLPFFLFYFVDLSVLFSQSCQTCVRIREKKIILVFMSINSSFTVAIHSCMSFEALKLICMHEIVKFFSSCSKFVVDVFIHQETASLQTGK